MCSNGACIEGLPDLIPHPHLKSITLFPHGAFQFFDHESLNETLSLLLETQLHLNLQALADDFVDLSRLDINAPCP